MILVLARFLGLRGSAFLITFLAYWTVRHRRFLNPNTNSFGNVFVELVSIAL